MQLIISSHSGLTESAKPLHETLPDWVVLTVAATPCGNTEVAACLA